MNIPFKPGDILIPKDVDMKEWSVIACDQYTSEPDYWNKVNDIVLNNPSTLNLVLPEIYLEESNVEERIQSINSNMNRMIDENIFDEYLDSMIYVERTLSNGKVREGLIGIIDLEDYNYEKGSQSLIRATEETVIERIPPRLKIRENAVLELPHILLLIDDNNKEIIELLKNKQLEKLYDFDLMLNGGHIKGYKLDKESIDEVINKLSVLKDKTYFKNKYNVDKDVLLFAVGDGNHSLATAKAYYEKLKKSLSEKEYLKHPARYALVELVNLHSEALEFEAIHRVLFDINIDNFINELYKYYDINEEGMGQKFELIYKDYDKTLYIKNPKSNLVVGSIQFFLDEYIKNNKGRIDYIHGEEVVRVLCSKDNTIGIIFDSMSKKDLFKTVILNGSLPRKTFSMGHANDKRYYLEARKLVRK